MNQTNTFALAVMAIATVCSAQTEPSSNNPAASTPNPIPTNAAPTSSEPISIQEMLVSGPLQLKLYSLAMITQGNVEGDVDESYLPGLKACAKEEAIPLRSVAAQILGQHFVEGKEVPNPEAVTLLTKLAKDDSSYVRYNAVYYGLTQIANKSDDIISLLIDVASTDREQGLSDRIAESLQKDHERVVLVLDKMLGEENNIAIFEIYEGLTGNPPPNADKYLDMPSSQPRLYIFRATGPDPEADKAELTKALQNIGIESPNIILSGEGESAVLLLKTYITKDYLAVDKNFENHPKFKPTQAMWLTPQLDTQLQERQKK